MSDSRTSGRDGPLLVVSVSAGGGFHRLVGGALRDLARDSERTPLVGAASAEPLCSDDARYAQVVSRSRAFLDRHLPDRAIVHVECQTLDGVPGALAQAEAGVPARDTRISLLLVDGEGCGLREDAVGWADEIEAAIGRWPAAIRPEVSPYGVVAYHDADKWQVQPVARYTLRQTPADEWVLAADVVSVLTDHVEVRRVRPAGGADTSLLPDTTMAAALHGFLTARAGSSWGLWSYTGSIVSTLISDLERLARAAGNPVLRGPSEHSLACGAMARWMLDSAPFLIVVTSAMVDEFRGTLANLRQAGARGFIVCADSAQDRWYPFQGTVHQAEDSREVLRARGLRAVYLSDERGLAAGLSEAFAAYDADEGPVVLLAAPVALESRSEPPPVPPRPVRARLEVGPPDQLDAVARLVNAEPVTLLWQVGAGADPGLLHEAARRCGAALADSLARPGTVTGYLDGRGAPNYLGTLGLYGFSEAVFHYLYRDGRLAPRTEQCLFFLGSRIAEVSTPFSTRTLRTGLRIVQVTHTAQHLAPFAEHPVLAETDAFLRSLLDRVDVDPDVLAARRAAIEAARAAAADRMPDLPVRPMTSSYFFDRLDTVLRRLIEDKGYEYTGVYDVGRGGAAAVRNLARTRAGFSGWYGRALMGDALQAVPSIALTRPGNVLAFIGDGAAALVPDIVPSLLQQLCLDGHELRGNLSIFRLLNGGHSIIRSYREARYREISPGQTTVFNVLDDDWSRTVGPVRVSHRRIDDVDGESLAAQLVVPGSINLYSVLLAHHNDGDGLSLLAARDWRHPQNGARL